MFQPDPQISQEALSRALRFGSDDLQANRAGHLSQGQRDALQWQYRGQASAAGVAALLPIAVLVAPLDGLGQIAGILVFVAALCLGTALWQLYLLRTILTHHEVKWAEGELSYPVSEMMLNSYRHSPPVYVAVQDEEFNVNLVVQGAFIPGWIYRLYYLPFPRRLISAEVVSTNTL